MNNLVFGRLLLVKAGVANLTVREIDPAPCKILTIFIRLIVTILQASQFLLSKASQFALFQPALFLKI
tara:strand:+ start:1382 stop:1585 length:204 start_codon:yes stop_codon:yes gene_type:complete